MNATVFGFDASACSGCKACLVACQDKHGLEDGRQWRRVYEAGGGGWQARGLAWQPQVNAYFVSMACNHCEAPICVEVCPSGAMYRRPDGLVLIDAARCLGCLYCAWACPYGAPQYHPAAGVMTKCTYCVEETDLGLPPACVAACPMRTLEAEALPGPAQAPHGGLLPDPRLTLPRLDFRPHAGVGVAPVQLANVEEVHHPRRSPAGLVAFTVLTPLAVGWFAWLALLHRWLPSAAPAWNLWLPVMVMLWALGASLMHLGKPWRAPLALRGMGHSWLSREVAFAGLTTLSMSVSAAFPSQGLPAAGGVLFGAATLFCIGQVYYLRTVPAWRGWFAHVTLWLSCFGLGGLAAAFAAGMGLLAELAWLALLVNVFLAEVNRRRVERLPGGLFSPHRSAAHSQAEARRWMLRLGLTVLAAVLINFHLVGPAMLIAIVGEMLGRYAFYHLHPNE